MASWSQVVAFSQPLTAERDYPAASNDHEAAHPDREVTFRVMDILPLLVWDSARRERRILGARWGFPHPQDWRRPQPIHARSESIEATKAFAKAFLDGQRGIALVKTFNEAPDVPGKTQQHTITPDWDRTGIAFIWRTFDVGASAPLYACVMLTVPANQLIATLPTDRMPAVLDQSDWGKWLGEESATVDELKAMLRTHEGVNWTMSKEAKRASASPAKATVQEPTGLF